MSKPQFQFGLARIFWLTAVVGLAVSASIQGWLPLLAEIAILVLIGLTLWGFIVLPPRRAKQQPPTPPAKHL